MSDIISRLNMPGFRLLIPTCTCFLLHSADGWMTSIPSLQARPKAKFGRTRIITNSGTADGDGNDSLTFDDEDCVDLCNLGDDSIFSPSLKPLPKQQTKEEEEAEAEKQRIRLEMHWELEQTKEECDVQDASTCSDACTECLGVGHTTCRFCMGAKQISLSEGNHVPCPVCDEHGKQVCQKCRGAGRVAPWTDLADFNPQS